MDLQRDGKRFGELMDQLHAALKEGFKANDALRDAYWKALRDVPYSEVSANVERIIATATRDTPFPRPSSLRNSPAKIAATAAPSSASIRAERDSIRNWNDLKKADPVAFQIEWRAARAFTAMAQCEDSSEEHQEWTREYQRWGVLRYSPRAEQEAAVRTYLGQSIEKRNAASGPSLRTDDRE